MDLCPHLRRLYKMRLKYTRENLTLLAEMLRGMLKDLHDHSSSNVWIFDRITIRSLARALEDDNPYVKNTSEKIKKLEELIFNNNTYLSNCVNTYDPRNINKHDKRKIDVCKNLALIKETKFEELPLHMNKDMDEFTKVYLNWRLKIGK